MRPERSGLGLIDCGEGDTGDDDDGVDVSLLLGLALIVAVIMSVAVMLSSSSESCKGINVGRRRSGANRRKRSEQQQDDSEFDWVCVLRKFALELRVAGSRGLGGRAQDSASLVAASSAAQVARRLQRPLARAGFCGAEVAAAAGEIASVSQSAAAAAWLAAVRACEPSVCVCVRVPGFVCMRHTQPVGRLSCAAASASIASCAGCRGQLTALAANRVGNKARRATTSTSPTARRRQRQQQQQQRRLLCAAERARQWH